MLIAHYIGKQRLFNRVVAWWDNGPISHTEAILAIQPDGRCRCGSSSYQDGGVRIKDIELKAEHWILTEIPAWDAARSEAWYQDHLGARYDYRGVISHLAPRIGDSKSRWYCNESIGASLNLYEPWRFRPNSFHALCLCAGGRPVAAQDWSGLGIQVK